MASASSSQGKHMEAEQTPGVRKLSGLCRTCKSLDLRFNDFPVAYRNPQTGELNFDCDGTRISLGTLQDILQRKDCPFCQLVVRVLQAQNPNITLEKWHRNPITLRETRDPITCSLQWYLQPAMDRSVPEQLETHSMFLGIRCSSSLLVDTYLVPHVDSAFAGGVETSQYYARDRGGIEDKANLASFWMHTCVGLHGSACIPAPLNLRKRSSPLTKVTFVDVWQGCLVERPLDCSYTALSYVWGSSPFFKSTKLEVSVLRQRLGLNAYQIPKTIQDAIFLTQRIGVRYLWVDSLCITQDDADSKHTMISMMDIIYAGAVLTIIALDGTDADAGLFVNKNRQQWHVRIKKNLKLVAIKTYFSDNSKDSFVHETRAWTYQEQILSRRQLIFADGLVFFVCQRAKWREDLITENSPPPSAYNPLHDVFDQGLEDEPYGRRIPGAYYSCVTEYTRRTMTYESDVLHAFTGISKACEDFMQTTLHFGLPLALLDWALLWRSEETLRPRTGFPTWSWAGWIGSVTFNAPDDACFMISLCSHTWIEFFCDDERLGRSVHISDLQPVRKPSRLALTPRERYRDYFRDVLMGHGETSTHNPLDRFPDSQFQTVPTGLGPPIKSGLLRFFTMSAMFELEVQDAIPDFIISKGFLIKDRFGDRAGFLYQDSEEKADIVVGMQEIILLSERFGEHRIRFPGEKDLFESDGDVRDIISQPERLRLAFNKAMGGHGLHDIEREEDNGPDNSSGSAENNCDDEREGEDSSYSEREPDDRSGCSHDHISSSEEDEFSDEDRAKLRRLRDPSNWTLYNVLAIRWQEGIAYRAAAGWLHREALDRVVSPGLQWKEINLG